MTLHLFFPPESPTPSIRERVHFRFIICPTCHHNLCWVNPRLPTYCPECGICIHSQLRRGTSVMLSDESAELIHHGAAALVCSTLTFVPTYVQLGAATLRNHARALILAASTEAEKHAACATAAALILSAEALEHDSTATPTESTP